MNIRYQIGATMEVLGLHLSQVVNPLYLFQVLPNSFWIHNSVTNTGFETCETIQLYQIGILASCAK